MTEQPIRALLFDLDGTFADTAPDLAQALNGTLTRHGREPLPFEAIRPVVSHGGMALIRLGFGLEPEHPDFEGYRRDLLDLYRANLCAHTRLFEGMSEVLAAVEAAGMPWGIVTNKPAWLTDPLMDALALSERAAAIVSGDTCEHRKPHPEPILHACRLAGVEPQDTLYVGDAERDIQAGRAAGTRTATALFGYLQEHDRPQDWAADFDLAHPLDLLPLLSLHDARLDHA